MVYTAMYYYYDQTDLMMASNNIDDMIEYDKECIISVWENRVKVDIHYKEGTWRSDRKESSLEKDELDVYYKFLKLNNLK